MAAVVKYMEVLKEIADLEEEARNLNYRMQAAQEQLQTNEKQFDAAMKKKADLEEAYPEFESIKWELLRKVME